MIPFLLTPLPAAFHHIYSSQSSSLKTTAGRQIINDLTATMIFSMVLYTLASAFHPQLDLLNWLGCPITVDNYGAMLSCSSIIFVLYIGPLVQTAFIEDEGQEFNLPELKQYVTDAFVVEALFRTCTVNLLLLGGLGFSSAVVLSAVVFTFVQTKQHFFGIAWQNALKHGTLNLVFYDVVTNFSFAVMLGFMFAKTGSYLAVVLVHIFKNFMGFPDLGFVFKAHRLYKFRFYIAFAYVVGIVGGAYLFKLILMEPDLFAPWFVNLAY
jgi:membrane protease YdiL (CAAX protease family)